MIPVSFTFYYNRPEEQDVGLKLVLFKITDEKGRVVTYDYGFAYWNGEKFDELEAVNGLKPTVHCWANTVDPSVLVSSLIVV